MATIPGVYLALFGRPADPTGLAFFNGITQNGADLSAIRGLAGTPEYLDRFDGFSNAQVVTAIYRALFGRDPDQAGLNFFVGELVAGRQTIETIAINILDGAQLTDRAIVNNKLAASVEFTNLLSSSGLAVAYVGNEAAELGRRFLVNITDDPATLETARANLGNVPTGITTKFTGQLADLYPDGTLVINDDNYLDSTIDDPDTMIVSGGADLVVNGEFVLRGDAGSVVVSGTSTTVAFNAWTSIADGPGADDEAVMTIANNAQVTAEDFAIAERRVFIGGDGNQINDIGGQTTGILNILSGGKLTINGFAGFASYFANAGDLNDGTETSTAFVNVNGAGSTLDLRDNYAEFGVTRGGVANVAVTSGGKILMAGGGTFGNVDNNSSAPGGEANVLVAGAGSAIINSSVPNGISFASGAGTIATLNVINGGLVRSAEYIGFGTQGGVADAAVAGGGRLEAVSMNVGRDNGQADVLIDGGVLALSGQDGDGFGAFLQVGRNSTQLSTLTVLNGGDVIIDGEHSLSPGFQIGRDGKGAVTVSGTGSTFVVKGDGPDLLDPDGFTGESFSSIGRGATGVGSFDVTNGGRFEGTANGLVDIGREGGTGSVLVDGVGSVFMAGAEARLGNRDGHGTVVVSNSGTFSTSADLFDDDTDVRIEANGRFTVSDGASVRGDIFNGGIFSVNVTNTQNTVDGDFFQDGTLDFDILGTSSAAATLAISGDTFLEGTITVDFLTGATLAAGNRIVLVDSDQGLGVDANLDVIFRGLSSTLDAQIQVGNGQVVLVIGAANAFADDLVVT